MRIAIVLALGAVTAATSAESLALGAALEASDSANPVLAASALRLDADRVAFDRASAAARASEAQIDELRAALQWERDQRTYDQSVFDERLRMAEAYAALQAAGTAVDLLERRLAVATADVRQVRERVAVGAASPVDELAAMVGLRSAEIALWNADATLSEVTGPSFAMSTGIDRSVILVADLDSPPPLVPELAPLEHLLETIPTRPEVQAPIRQTDIDDLELERLLTQRAPSLDLQSAAAVLAISIDAIAATQRDLEAGVRATHVSARAAIMTADLRRQQFALQGEQTRRTAQQHAAGLRTDSELALAEIEVRQAAANQRDADWDVYFAWLRLQRTAGIEVTVGEDP